MQKFACALVSFAAMSAKVSAWYPYYSGSLKTYETFTYGKFRTSMKMQDIDATVGTFFTYWEGPNWSAGKWNEIDIEIVPSCEIQQYPSDPFNTNIHYGDGVNHKTDHEQVPIPDIWDTYKTYEIIWTPDFVQWTQDG